MVSIEPTEVEVGVMSEPSVAPAVEPAVEVSEVGSLGESESKPVAE